MDQTNQLEIKHDIIPKNKKLLKIIGIIVGSIIILVSAVIIFTIISTSSPSKISDQFVSAFQSNNPTLAHNLMTADAKAETDIEDLTSLFEQASIILTGKPNLKSNEISTEINKNKTAVISYEILANDNITKYNITFNMQENNNKWEVLNFKIEDQSIDNS